MCRVRGRVATGPGRVVLLVLLFAVSLGVPHDAAGDEHLDQFGDVDTVGMIAFPWLPRGDMIDQSGPWYGSVTVQNLESKDVRIWALTDAGFDPDGALGTFVLPPNGAITLSAAALGIQEPGSPLVIAGVFRAIWEADIDAVDSVITETCEGVLRDPSSDIWRDTCKPSISGVAKLTSPEPLSGATGNRTTEAHLSVDGYNGIPAQDVAWGSQSRFCRAIVSVWNDDCSGVGTYEPLGSGVGFVFDGHSYLPIAQTNSGWNTVLRVSNVDPSVWAGQVNVTLIASHQQGHGASEEHRLTFETTLRPGESWALDLREHGIPDGWVGSAHITSNVGVVAQALRVNPEQDMLMTNLAAPSSWATTSRGTEEQETAETAGYQFTGDDGVEMFAPLVFREYNGWNTGISIVNIDEASNRVTLSFYDMGGGLQRVETRRIPAQGQEYVYIPAREGPDLGLDGWTGAVRLSADQPFHAAIDQVKYSTGEAMSYLATAAGARDPNDPNAGEFATDSLSLPLMQRGNLDGAGDMSGIQLFNTGSDGSTEINVTFHSEVGDRLPPTNYGPIRATIPARGSYTLYAMNLRGMIPNATGTATVRVVEGSGQITAVSNNVNYAVQGDGSSAFNLVNSWGQYRFPVSQTE